MLICNWWVRVEKQRERSLRWFCGNFAFIFAAISFHKVWRCAKCFTIFELLYNMSCGLTHSINSRVTGDGFIWIGFETNKKLRKRMFSFEVNSEMWEFKTNRRKISFLTDGECHNGITHQLVELMRYSTRWWRKTKIRWLFVFIFRGMIDCLFHILIFTTNYIGLLWYSNTTYMTIDYWETILNYI